MKKIESCLTSGDEVGGRSRSTGRCQRVGGDSVREGGRVGGVGGGRGDDGGFPGEGSGVVHLDVKVVEGSHQRSFVSWFVGHGSEGFVDGFVQGVPGDEVLGRVVKGDEGFKGFLDGTNETKEEEVRTSARGGGRRKEKEKWLRSSVLSFISPPYPFSGSKNTTLYQTEES